jgi:hypothetical protein
MPITSSWREAPWDPRPQFLFSNFTLAVIVLMQYPLWREDVSVVYKCRWASAALSFPGPSPAGPLTTVYSLTLHDWLQLNYALIFSRRRPRTENTPLTLLRACLEFPRDRYPASPLARWLLPSNGLGTNYIENNAPVLLATCLFERV